MITIIGAGPAGNYLAYLLSKKHQDVTIIEEHKKVGFPVQCTGIVTPSIDRFVILKQDVIANKLSKVIVISKSNNINIKVNEIVLWRDKFDQSLNDMAAKHGAKTIINHQFHSLDGKKSILVKDKKSRKIKKIKSDVIIGADGPNSSVAKAARIPLKTGFYVGMQAKVKLKIDPRSFETYFGSKFPNFFGWCVPESENITRMGLCSIKDIRQYFNNFLKTKGNPKIIKWESGIIPIYSPKQIIQKANVYLIGDAAAHVKATTGGGIIPSLKAAHSLCDSIIYRQDYNKQFKKNSGSELLLHLKIRNVLNKFTDKDYDYLLELMDQEKVKHILNKYDRDSPIALVTNLLFKEPRFLRYFPLGI